MRVRIFLAHFSLPPGRRELDSQLDEELRFHLDMETEANRNRGMTNEEAAWAANARLAASNR